MARRLVVRLFGDTVRYAEALELQVCPLSRLRCPHPSAREVPTPFRPLTPDPFETQESIASARRAGTVADTLLVLQVSHSCMSSAPLPNRNGVSIHQPRGTQTLLPMVDDTDRKPTTKNHI